MIPHGLVDVKDHSFLKRQYLLLQAITQIFDFNLSLQLIVRFINFVLENGDLVLHLFLFTVLIAQLIIHGDKHLSDNGPHLVFDIEFRLLFL